MLRILFYGFEYNEYLLMCRLFNALGISVACIKNPNSKLKSVLRLEDRKYKKIGNEPILICDGITPEYIRVIFSENEGLIKFDGIIASVTSTNKEWKVRKLIHELQCEKEAMDKIMILRSLIDECRKIDVSTATEDELEYLDEWISKAALICNKNITDLEHINIVTANLRKIMKKYHI